MANPKISVRIGGNKMPTRCNVWFLLQILLLAKHVSGTIMPIIRSSSIIQVVAACGAEGYVSGLRAAARKPDT